MFDFSSGELWRSRNSMPFIVAQHHWLEHFLFVDLLACTRDSFIAACQCTMFYRSESGKYSSLLQFLRSFRCCCCYYFFYICKCIWKCGRCMNDCLFQYWSIWFLLSIAILLPPSHLHKENSCSNWNSKFISLDLSFAVFLSPSQYWIISKDFLSTVRWVHSAKSCYSIWPA